MDTTPTQSGDSARYLSPHLFALLCLAALIFALLAANFASQHSLQRSNVLRYQKDLEKRALSIGYFLSERENDIRELAAAEQVAAFFANRELGMTMAYGLRASLNNISRLFSRRMASSLLGRDPIYSRLILLDAGGDALAQYPGETADILPCIPVTGAHEAGRVIILSDNAGRICFTCPIYLNSTLQGFIRGWVDYSILASSLLDGSSGLLFITDQTRQVFPPPADHSLTEQSLNQLSRDDAVWPLELRRNELVVSDRRAPAPANPAMTVFGAVVPNYGIMLLQAEESRVVTHMLGRFFSMGILMALSGGVFLVAVTTLRANTRNMLLTTSLAETKKREQEVADKKAELELIIDSARLGTWIWDIGSGAVVFNRHWSEMLGYEAEDIAPHVDSWAQLVHPEDMPAVMQRLEAHLRGEAPVYRAEHRLRHKNGHWVWVLDAGRVLRRDAAGTPLLAMGIHLNISERMEAERGLSRAKEESDTIIKNFLDTMIVVDRQLIVRRVNQATCELLGFEEPELLGRHVSTLFHDPDQLVPSIFSFYRKDDADVFGGREELRNMELWYRTRDNRHMPMSFNISLLRDDDGEVSGVVAGAKDISQLKILAAQIVRQKDYIEKLFDVVPESLLALSDAGEIVTHNRAFSALVDEWAARFALPTPRVREELLGALGATPNPEEQCGFSLSHHARTAFFRRSAAPVSSIEGIARVIALQDITEERKASAAKKLLATVIEQTDDTVIITDTDGTIRYANPAAGRNTGYLPEELQGQKPSIFKSGLVPLATYEELWRTITAGKVWAGQLISRKKDGAIMEEEATISPVRDEQGEIANFVAIKRDVTAMKLMQQRLLQAQKLEAIGQLSAGIAHEINTPMQYVQNNVTFCKRTFQDLAVLLRDYSLLREDGDVHLSAEAREHLRGVDLDFLMEEIPEGLAEMQDGINRVVRIVSAMKEFSHPGSGEKVPTDLNRAMESTVTVCRNEWKYVAEMAMDFDRELPLVPCLPDQLNQAVLNLIINAAHAIAATGAEAPVRPGHITVSTRRDGEWTEIRVSDDGCGMTGEVSDHIFEPFFTTKEVGKGTGQGMAIVYDVVVRKHGGTIDFTSAPGRGTTFILRIPLTGPSEEAA